LFKDSKSAWGWLKADDIEAIRPFAIALEGFFSEENRNKFDSLFSFFQITAKDILSPVTLVAAAVPPRSKVLFKTDYEVDVNYKGRGEWHRGKVIKVNQDNQTNFNYDVKFEGGLEEKSVEVQLMTIASVSGYAYLEKECCYFWKKNVKHFIVLEQGVLSYGESAHKKCQPLYLKEGNLTQELRARPSIILDS
jgi:hypothetical protein